MVKLVTSAFLLVGVAALGDDPAERGLQGVCEKAVQACLPGATVEDANCDRTDMATSSSCMAGERAAIGVASLSIEFA